MAKWSSEDWNRSEDAEKMLRTLGSKNPRVSRRKLRLFTVAACLRFREWVTDRRCHAALAAAERDADEPLSEVELHAARNAAEDALLELHEVTEGWREKVTLVAVAAFGQAIEPEPITAAVRVTRFLTDLACLIAGRESKNVPASGELAAARQLERNLQANLLRHIVGNPFRPFPAPAALPSTVVQLAAAMEAGEPVAFALRDALLEAGQTELAEHFGGDEPHPRGCWALDVIGGRA